MKRGADKPRHCSLTIQANLSNTMSGYKAKTPDASCSSTNSQEPLEIIKRSYGTTCMYMLYHLKHEDIAENSPISWGSIYHHTWLWICMVIKLGLILYHTLILGEKFSTSSLTVLLYLNFLPLLILSSLESPHSLVPVLGADLYNGGTPPAAGPRLTDPGGLSNEYIISFPRGHQLLSFLQRTVVRLICRTLQRKRRHAHVQASTLTVAPSWSFSEPKWNFRIPNKAHLNQRVRNHKSVTKLNIMGYKVLKLSLSLALCCPFMIVDLLLHVLNDIIRLGPAWRKNPILLYASPFSTADYYHTCGSM